MPPSPVHAVACVCACTLACDPSPVSFDASLAVDASLSADVLVSDGGVSVDGEVLPDGPADSFVDDEAPQLTVIEPPPMSEVWLHEPIRLQFDEPISLANAAVQVQLGGEPVAFELVGDGSTGALVVLGGAVRGIGELEVRVQGIEDVAGNVSPPFEARYTAAPWHRPAIDRGSATGSPSIAIGRSLVAAWVVGSGSDRRVVVSQHERGMWRPLGGLLGMAATSSVAIAIDASERPVVGWIEGGVARVMRWESTDWVELPSLGAATELRLAGAVSALVVAGSTAVVHRLVGDAWVPQGEGVAMGDATHVVFAVPAQNTAVIGWIEGGAVRVDHYDGSWSALPAIGQDPSSLAIDASGATIAIAWAEASPSSGVYVARSTESGWTRLGGVLDVDAAGNASAPAIALDGTAPVVAWRERIEGVDRGVLARWSGSSWTLVGGHTWLREGQPTPPALALANGGAPVVAWTAGNAAQFARFNGPKTPPPGLAQRGSITGCEFSATSPPANLLQTGCFTLPAPAKPAPHAGLVPYDIVTELWSDGTLKRRWVGLPENASMTLASNGAWAAPVGTFVVKEFAIETTPGAPSTRRAIETRFLVLTSNGWQGFTYRWRENGSDADLLNDGTFTTDWSLDGGGTYRHLYPSRSACLSCHDNSYGPLLGLRPQQLQRWFDYGGIIADQLPTLAGIEVGPVSTAAAFPSPHDSSVSVQQRTRAYMAANCAHCHNPSYLSIKDLQFTTPLSQTKLCQSITPGSPEQSRVYQLVTQRPGMPALGTLLVDPLAADLLGRWITEMSSCP